MSQRRRQRVDDGEAGAGAAPKPHEEELVQKEWQGGQLYYAELINCMSHAHFRVDFCPHMNFLIGPNGAGKSATLIAIAFCLGARANITARFSKVADAIMNGMSSATIRVGIVNVGEDRWRERDYGGVITVERKLRREGASTVKLYGGVPVSGAPGGGLVPVEPLGGRSAGEELKTVLDRFRIQPNNPCTILMQEKAREFLTTSNPKQLYKFWHDATLLSEVIAHLHQVKTLGDSASHRRAAKAEQMPAMRAKVEEYKTELLEMQERQQLAERIREMQTQVVWVAVAAVEREAEKGRQIGLQAEENMHKFDKKAALAREKATAEEARAQAVRAETDELQVEARRMEAARQAAETEVKARRREVNAAENKVEHRRGELDVLVRRVARLDKEIQEAAGSSRVREQVAALTKERGDVEAEIRTAEERRKRAEATAAEAQARVDEAVAALEEAAGALSAAQKRREAAARRLADVKRGGRGAEARGGQGERVARLVAENERLFSRRPLGPVGDLVKVRDAKYSDAVESAIRASVHRFLLNADADLAALRALCRQHNVPLPPTTTRRFAEAVYDTRANEPPAGQMTVLRAVTAEHAEVLNHLIDQYAIESTLICDDVNEARDRLFTRHVAKSKAAFTLRGQKFSLNRGMQEVNTAAYQAKTVMSDVAGATLKAQQDLDAAERELATRQTAHRDAADAREKAAKHEGAMRVAVQREEAALNRLRPRLTAVKRQLEDLEADLNVDIDELKRSRDALLAGRDAAQAAVEAAVAEVAEQKAHVAPFEAKAAEAREAGRRLTERIDKLIRDIDSVVEIVGRHDRECREAEAKAQSMREKKAEAEAGVAAKEAEIAVLSAKAAAVGARPAALPNTTAAALQAEIEQKTARARREAEGKKAPGEIVEQYEAAAAKEQATVAQLASLLSVCTMLEAQHGARVQHYRKMRKLYSQRMQTYFLRYISQRGYAGTLDFEHDEEHLRVEVDVENRHQDAQRAVQTLSGGERMFSTLALLLSLWMTVEAPFYALDEFDVFMDAMHRSKSLQLLGEHARREGKARQFIFISPQSTDGMPRGPDVRSFALRAPERGPQATL